MYQIKQGFARKSANLPDICIVVAYNADKTVNLFNRDGNSLLPISKFNPDKWNRIELPEVEKALAEKLQAKEVHILETNSQRNTAGAITL